ncbi:MAG: sugar phosphate isomerase/epimerase [Oscillospiraceae bacterium]|nr:sugar phosphate isomerase/epimerase [Oscillospiraceae bacterium]
MELGISIYGISRKIMTGEMSPEKGVEWLAETGAEVIEIVPFGIDIVENKNLAAELNKIAKENGSVIANYSLNANFLMLNHEDYNLEFERVKKHIDAAAKLEVKTMRIDSSSYRRKPEDNTIENFMSDLSVIAEVYDKLCGYAKQYNITVLLENHGFHINGSDRVGIVLNQIEQEKIENFSCQLDIGNFLCVDENPEVAVKRLINKAGAIHMKDFYIRDEDCDPGDATQFDCSGAWFRSQHGLYLRGSILCQGDMRIGKIAALIKQSGFDGNIYLEYEGMEDCFYGTKVGFENMKKLLGK